MNDINERIAKIKNQIIETKIARLHLGLTEYDEIIDEFEFLITTIESQNSQIESLKAITELAVKGLKGVSDVDTSSYSNDTWQMRDIANATLSEIERLQNG